MLHLWAAGPTGALPGQFIFGLVFGWLRAKTASLLPCMLCHAAVNVTLFSLVVE